MDMQEKITRIDKLRKKRNAVILAHNYVLPEIQDIADFVGDSLELSIKAQQSDAPIIVFCGVSFMAETAKILSPESMVLHPNPASGCPMADMIDAQKVRSLKKEFPHAVTVCYVNSTAAVKAEVDICCTSANAEKIVSSIPENQEVIFMPDKNLGANVANELQREITLFPGYCPTHDRILPRMLADIKQQYPHAEALVHPECSPEVVELADYALSTGGILRYARQSNKRQFIIGTEEGILHRLRKENPGKEFILLNTALICPNMKKISIDDVLKSLENLQYEVDLSPELIEKARRPIEKMLELS
ncbi:MAG: quinolinate synthase NadA [Lentisphaerae bacterium]|nr:quinolinate synthase NadA [Lentisphaerota bacterium]